MFKTLKNILSITNKTIETTLDVTNYTLNEVNKGLESINKTIKTKNEIYNIAEQVYKNKISCYQAIQIVKNSFGLEGYHEFENQLNKFRTLDYKSKSYEIFGINEEYKILDKEIVKNELIKKYGTIDETILNSYIKDRKSDIARFLSRSGKFDYFKIISMDEHKLAKIYIEERKRIEDTLKALKL